MDDLYILDGHSLVHRAYHTMSEADITKNGQSVAAVYGFTKMLFTIFREHEPAYAVCPMDADGPTFRNELYEGYEDNKNQVPTDLQKQITIIKKLLSRLNIPVIVEKGYSCNDVVASISKKWKKKLDNIIIVSNDKDNMQLLSDTVRLLKLDSNFSKVEWYGADSVKEDYDVKPKQIPDYTALVGDRSENIPGISGVGSAYAARLLNKYNSIEAIINNIDNIDQVIPDRLVSNIEENKDQLKISKKLSTLRDDINIDVSLDAASLSILPYHEMASFCQDMEFSSLVGDVHRKAKEASIRWAGLQLDYDYSTIEELVDSPDTLYQLTKDDQEICGFLWSETERLLESNEVYYVIGNQNTCVILKLNPSSTKVGKYYSLREYLYENGLVLFDQRKVNLLEKRIGIDPKKANNDLKIASYLLSPDQEHTITKVVERYSEVSVPNYDKSWAIKRKGQWLSRINKLLIHIKSDIDSKINSAHQSKIINNIELPLSLILSKMEYTGLKININTLREVESEYKQKKGNVKDKMQDKYGKKFNPDSLKAIRGLLFNELDLPINETTKDGKPSTSKNSLLQLTSHHEAPQEVLDYRHYSMIINNYINSIDTNIDRENRIHPKFLQTKTGIGRISSKKPNIHNLPVNTKGASIRKLIIPNKDNQVLLNLEYEQLELRILAHRSRDQSLIDIFKSGDDVHKETAANLLDKDSANITSQERKIGKMVNYGTIYGMTAYGISHNLNINHEKAQKYIKKNYKQHPGVQAYRDRIIEKAYENNYVETMLGRRRYVPDLQSSNYKKRKSAERAAISSAIRGTSADFIKNAMIKLNNQLSQYDCRIAMQIYDEIVIEVDDGVVDQVANTARNLMREVVDLSIPITVTTSSGANWEEASKTN